MDELLARLRQYAADHPNRCFFRPAASAAAIAEAEAAIGLPLPNDYKQFLATFDGGFISICGEPGDEYWTESTARWNSNSLSGVEQLVAEFKDVQLIWKVDLNWEGPWPYIPFCNTNGQERLVFGAPEKSGESPVLDAFHEVGPEEWRQLYPCFAALLSAYLAGDGQMNTIAGVPNP
jgi:hypothetical protein